MQGGAHLLPCSGAFEVRRSFWKPSRRRLNRQRHVIRLGNLRELDRSEASSRGIFAEQLAKSVVCNITRHLILVLH